AGEIRILLPPGPSADGIVVRLDAIVSMNVCAAVHGNGKPWQTPDQKSAVREIVVKRAFEMMRFDVSRRSLGEAAGESHFQPGIGDVVAPPADCKHRDYANGEGEPPFSGQYRRLSRRFPCLSQANGNHSNGNNDYEPRVLNGPE